MDLPSVVDVAACAAAGAAAGTAAGACVLRRRSASLRSRSGGPAGEAAFAALHTITRASPPLRAGLGPESAQKAARHLRALLGAEAVALIGLWAPQAEGDPCGVDSGGGDPGALHGADGAGGADGGPPGPSRASGASEWTDASGRVDAADVGGSAAGRLLAWDGLGGGAHIAEAVEHALPVLASGRPRVIAQDRLPCADPRCRVRVAMVAPLTVEGRVEGALAAYWPGPSAARVRAVGEAARWVTGQLELAELDSVRIRLAEAEMRALRAQISPHFVYNSLTTIASFVRTDPGRARELLLDFADFARYSFRNPRDFTTLADELRSIDRYLLLERARFGERLQFSVEVAPEVLPVAVPFLALQPLVENAIRHGMEGAREAFHISIVARDSGAEAAISVEDDGVGMDPERLQEILSAPLGRPGPTGWGSVAARGRRDRGCAGIGLANVDERMRQVYGDEYGLTVETALGAGTKVKLRVPKYRPGVFPD
ncbi:sensor histidine kinase [Actinomadura fibrosa]|uniref:histidine kinase n=1 Tax=Actinomadura fibrosa TaxID=111802 RepID=A0ABW2XK52_9ACTN|nr:histidine kinase [Actinomadura fibrosa]